MKKKKSYHSSATLVPSVSLHANRGISFVLVKLNYDMNGHIL